ncbi:ABC transporter ATP-binding protein [Cyanobium sp. ULC082]
MSPRRRRQLLVLQVFSLLAAVGEVANIGALLPFLRLLANPQDGLEILGPLSFPLSSMPSDQLLLVLGLGFMVVVVVSICLRLFTTILQVRLGVLIVADLGERVFASVLMRPYSWHIQQNSSSILSYLTTDIDQVCASIQSLLILVVNLSIVVLLASSLIALSPTVMLVVSVLLAGFYLLVFRFTKASLRLDGQRRAINYQAFLKVTQEGLGGIRDVLLDQTQGFFLDAYRSRFLNYRLAGGSINIKAQVPRYLIEGFSLLIIVALSLLLALSGEGVEQQLPLLGTLSLGAYRLLTPLQQCFTAVGNLQANQASLRRIEPFLASVKQPTGIEPATSTSTRLPSGCLPSTNSTLFQLQKISYRYSSDRPWVIRDLDLNLTKGERLAFVGTTGSGKSTCCDLILGLLAPTKGTILVNGENLHNTPGLAASWRSRVSHVPQQIYLSDASFAANIAFGVPEDQINHQRVREAAEQARIAEVITSNPEGYSAFVGERGVRLSGGQRQRIGIARALYKQSDLLVLDEATSALDNRTEAEVMKAIEELDRRLTVILIAHRLTTVRNCDRIILLEMGRIAAIGSYRELEAGHFGFHKLV